jgi:integrase
MTRGPLGAPRARAARRAGGTEAPRAAGRHRTSGVPAHLADEPVRLHYLNRSVGFEPQNTASIQSSRSSSAATRPDIGDIPLQRLSGRDLDRLYKALRESGGRGGRPLRGKSVRNAHTTLKKALSDAVRRGHLAVNPVDAVDPPARGDSVERTGWSATEVRAFLDVAASDRLSATWRLALATGLRRGELLGLTWDDVDEGSVHVRRQVLLRPRAVQGTRRLFVRSTLKNRRARRVRLDEQTAAEFHRWKATRSAERLAFGPAWKTDGGSA